MTLLIRSHRHIVAPSLATWVYENCAEKLDLQLLVGLELLYVDQQGPVDGYRLVVGSQ